MKYLFRRCYYYTVLETFQYNGREILPWNRVAICQYSKCQMYNILPLHKCKNSVFTDSIGFACKIVNKSDSQSLANCSLTASILKHLILIFDFLFLDVLLSIFLKEDEDGLQIGFYCSNGVCEGVVVCILDWHHLHLLILHHISFVLFCFLEYFRGCYVCFVFLLQIYVANQLVAELE